jgi:hypothetical protein
VGQDAASDRAGDEEDAGEGNAGQSAGDRGLLGATGNVLPREVAPNLLEGRDLTARAVRLVRWRV